MIVPSSLPTAFLPSRDPYSLLDKIVCCEDGWCFARPLETERGAIQNGALGERIVVPETEDGVIVPRFLVPMIRRVDNYE